MDLPSPRYALKARYLFPVDRPPFTDATIVVNQGKIEAVDVASPDCPTVDLGKVALIPGLVNAHAHLEFSDLDGPLGHPGIGLPDWIRQVLQHRSNRSREERALSVREGIAESVGHGTVAIGEISPDDWPLAEAHSPNIDLVVFRELICLRTQQVDEVAGCIQRLFQTSDSCSHLHPAVSPHAPFTCRREAIEVAVAASRRHQIPLAMHLAESPEELEWLNSGKGTLADLLAARQAETYVGPGSPLDYIRRLAPAHRSLVIHGNYLSAAEIDELSAASERMAVVFCPRTHRYFQHPPYPLERLLASGALVAVGTDGRGSNPDLSLLGELRQIAAVHSSVPLAKVLEMGTLAGAMAMGLDQRIGSLTPGKEASFAIVPLAGIDRPDPHEELLRGDTPVQGTILRGAAV